MFVDNVTQEVRTFEELVKQETQCSLLSLTNTEIEECIGIQDHRMPVGGDGPNQRGDVEVADSQPENGSAGGFKIVDGKDSDQNDLVDPKDMKTRQNSPGSHLEFDTSPVPRAPVMHPSTTVAPTSTVIINSTVSPPSSTSTPAPLCVHMAPNVSPISRRQRARGHRQNNTGTGAAEGKPTCSSASLALSSFSTLFSTTGSSGLGLMTFNTETSWISNGSNLSLSDLEVHVSEDKERDDGSPAKEENVAVDGAFGATDDATTPSPLESSPVNGPRFEPSFLGFLHKNGEKHANIGRHSISDPSLSRLRIGGIQGGVSEERLWNSLPRARDVEMERMVLRKSSTVGGLAGGPEGLFANAPTTSQVATQPSVSNPSRNQQQTRSIYDRTAAGWDSPFHDNADDLEMLIDVTERERAAKEAMQQQKISNLLSRPTLNPTASRETTGLVKVGKATYGRKGETHNRNHDTFEREENDGISATMDRAPATTKTTKQNTRSPVVPVLDPLLESLSDTHRLLRNRGRTKLSLEGTEALGSSYSSMSSSHNSNRGFPLILLSSSLSAASTTSSKSHPNSSSPRPFGESTRQTLPRKGKNPIEVIDTVGIDGRESVEVALLVKGLEDVEAPIIGVPASPTVVAEAASEPNENACIDGVETGSGVTGLNYVVDQEDQLQITYRKLTGQLMKEEGSLKSRLSPSVRPFDPSMITVAPSREQILHPLFPATLSEQLRDVRAGEGWSAITAGVDEGEDSSMGACFDSSN
ncbi:hypothetical protein HK102_006894 [Quaeritorhiza haematococci]|nr:hypothetical protein HK102_006894 [Quaeritorhiza haematococci]